MMAQEEDSTCMHPMSEKKKVEIDCVVDEICKDYWCEPEERGKWMLFFTRDIMDRKWQEAVKLYKNRELTGIQSLQCSTAAPNPRARDNVSGVIRFFCGPYHSKAMKSYGENVVEKMKYTNNYGVAAYKTDKQSKIGTGATGTRKNYIDRIPVPTKDRYMQELVN